MKNIALTLFLLAFAGPMLKAQDWLPIRMDDTLFFATDSHMVVGLTLLSEKREYGHSLYEFSLGTPDVDLLPYVQNKVLDSEYVSTPSIIGAQMLVKEAGNVYLRDTSQRDSFLLKTYARNKAQWLFNAKTNTMATVDSIVFDSLGNIADSFKYINVSNGQQLVLSKHHGIVRCPELFKYGEPIKQRSYHRTTDKRITVRDVNDFDVGDVFHVQYSGGESIDTVMSKDTSGDEVVYTIKSLQENRGEFGTFYRKVTYEQMLNYSDSLLFKELPGQLNFRKSFLTPLWAYYLYDSSQFSQYERTHVYEQRAVGWNYKDYTYIVGAGSYYYENLEGSPWVRSSNLVYYKKATHAWGQQVIIGKKEVPTPVKYGLYPNPALSSLSVSGIEQPINAYICDQIGQVQAQMVLQNGTLDIDFLEAGMYFLILENGARLRFQVLR